MSEPTAESLEIPWNKLDPDVLRRLVEEFVTREGTDYGFEATLDAKVREVQDQLRRGTAAIVFDPVGETTTIVARQR